MRLNAAAVFSARSKIAAHNVPTYQTYVYIQKEKNKRENGIRRILALLFPTLCPTVVDFSQHVDAFCYRFSARFALFFFLFQS